MSGTLAEGRGDLGVRLAPAAVAVGEVGHSEDAGQQRDGLALQPLKVAGAVVIFAVIPHGLGHPVYDLEFLNDAAAPLYIGLVELVLLLGDVPLQYHIIGQAHGAYFVQQARIVAVPAGGLIPSIGLLLGIYCGGMYGGSISAILIHAPGTPAAAATLLDGYPMCKKGQAGKALSVAMFASFCGGVIGALIMTFLSPLVADMAMNFGPGEMFMLAVFGLSVIVAISGKSVAKGLISAFFGMLLCTVGLDPTNGIPRFITTKQTGLLDGFQFIPTLIGLFAVSEVIAGVERIIRGEEHEQKSNEKITNVLPDWKTIKRIWPNILSGGLIGTFIGAIPGAGGDIAVFVSYGASKSASKHPELYGTGIPNGVAATESANNGCSGGAMIPLLSLGVPGDSVTAILLGAFIMKGITPGPMMYVTELPTVYRVFAALMLANLCMLVVGCLGVRFFAKIVSVEKKMLYPIILVISLLGAFSINKNAFDVGVCVAFGIIGWLMNKYEFPLSPILLALILGPMCEKNFVRYMNIQRGDFFAITTSPIAMVFATVAILVIVYSVYNQSKINKRAAANAAQEKA